VRQNADFNITLICSNLQGNVYYKISYSGPLYSQSSWLGPVPADEPFITSKSIDTIGEYSIRAKVHGENGVISDWSDPLPIVVSKARLFSILEGRFSQLHLLFERLIK
jgi:hypothetical protein